MDPSLNAVSHAPQYISKESKLEHTENLNTTVEGKLGNRKFESILVKELYSHKEGQSKLRTVAIAVLSTITGLFAVTAIYDAIRYGLFQYGKCDGKSWSLIDKAEKPLSELSSKIRSVFSKNVESLSPAEQKNIQLKGEMKRQVNKIVEGFKQQNGSFFNPNKLFSAPSAIAGRKQIISSQEKLASAMGEFLENNVSNTSEFSTQFNELKEHVRTLFNESAKDSIFIRNKFSFDHSPLEYVRDLGFNGVMEHLQANVQIGEAYLSRVDKDYISDQELNIAPNAPQGESIPNANLVKNLKSGVNAQVITLNQAKAKLTEHLKEAFIQTLEATGRPLLAEKAAESLLNEGTKGDLINQEEKVKVNYSYKFTPNELATAVSNNIIEYKMQTPSAPPATLDQMRLNASDELKSQNRLQDTEEVEFLHKVEELVTKAQLGIDEQLQEAFSAEQSREAEKTQQLQAQEKEEQALKAAAEAEMVVATQKAEQAAKVEVEQKNLMTVMNDMLGKITKAQENVSQQYNLYNAQNTSKGELVEQYNFIRKMKVNIGEEGDKTEMTIFQAMEHRERQLAKIYTSNKTPYEQLELQAKFDKDFGSDAIKLITVFGAIENQLKEQTIGMRQRLEGIKVADKEVEKATRYDISSLQDNAKNYQQNIRSHWGVENKLRWILDIAFSEDASRKRNKNAAQNYSILLKITLNLLKNEKLEKQGVAGKRLKAG